MIRPVHSRRQSRGFVMLIAVLVLGIVGAALAVLTLGISNDGRRTRNRLLDAQLEQMLLVANAQAPPKLAATPAANQSWSIDLPGDLAECDGALTLRVQSIESSDVITCFVRATLDRRLAEETVQLHRNAGKWHIVSTQLNG